ncbi:hypothetical protein OWR29_03495 [Actinoplanes sp. Pm04-4]|uniref:Secreted protein n=1 Tax=Paractinoplanes pyxinae TaxID=2997416 RepID=A0ABT4AS21_9ACTN|nr:hypothetical protein [Actinoplanes pyxinae]MCY1137048.1 hypothetical protein [Actinoplanes pyxinae]
MRRRHFLLGAAGIVLAVPSRAVAAPPAAPDLVADPAGAERDFVRWLSVHAPRRAVQQAAGQAVDGDTAAFLSSGYPAALSQAARDRADDLEYANRMAAEHPAADFPWVNAAARRAANGTDEELAEFGGTGYAAALAQDNAHVPYDDGASLVSSSDWDYVDSIRFVDPGSVAVERAGAVRTDADVAEFLRHGWPSAARIDVDAFRGRYVADELAQWQQANYQIRIAVAADVDPYAALQAWDVVRRVASRQPSAWAERERYARGRADDWLRLAYTASDSDSPLWATLAVDAWALQERWTKEVPGAIRQADWWRQLDQYAQAAIEELIHGW